MNDRRTISVPCVAYNRAKAHAKAIRASLSGFVSKLITEDLAAAGVSEDDPGTPTLPRFRSETAQGPRTSFSVTGLLYRRTRVHAAAIKTPLWIYAVRLVEAELERVGFPAGDPGPQERGRGGAPRGPRSPLVRKAARPSSSIQPPSPKIARVRELLAEREGEVDAWKDAPAQAERGSHRDRIVEIDAVLAALIAEDEALATAGMRSPSPSPAPKDPALLAADEARCAEALATVGMSSAGIFLL